LKDRQISFEARPRSFQPAIPLSLSRDRRTKSAKEIPQGNKSSKGREKGDKMESEEGQVSFSGKVYSCLRKKTKGDKSLATIWLEKKSGERSRNRRWRCIVPQFKCPQYRGNKLLVILFCPLLSTYLGFLVIVNSHMLHVTEGFLLP